MAAKLCVGWVRMGRVRVRRRKDKKKCYTNTKEEGSGGWWEEGTNGTYAEGSAQSLDVGLVHFADTRERGAHDRAGLLLDALLDHVGRFVLEALVGREVLAGFFCSVVSTV